LFELLRHVDRSAVDPEVICRRSGPIEDSYRDIGIPCRVEPRLPKCSSLRRFSRNVLVYGRAYAGAARNWRVVRSLKDEVRNRFDVVHFNHEGFFQLASWLRRGADTAQVMHLRTNVADTVFARWQARTISRSVDRIVFITEHERQTFQMHGGNAPGSVVFNIASPDPGAECDPRIPDDGRLVAASLANYEHGRGVDRLVEVAEALQSRGAPVVFAVAGDMRLPRHLGGALGAIGDRGGTLEGYAAARGVADQFVFLGHVTQPERVLAAADVLVKPTRESNPWGRDIIEAMTAGKPVFSVGTWQQFIEHDVTGFIEPEFDAARWADRLSTLANNREQLAQLGASAHHRAAKLFDGPARAADVVNIWRQAFTDATNCP
jgi:glycosyltransferase involved in cell wall biosynthesis